MGTIWISAAWKAPCRVSSDTVAIRLFFEKRALKALLATPRVLRTALARFAEPKVRRQLDPDLRLLMAISGLRPPLDALSVRNARQEFSAIIELLDVPREAVAYDHHQQLTHETGHFGVRIYRPLGVGDLALPGVLFFHGGGHTVGRAADYDHVCRFLANRLGAVLVSVDYRLAPENRFPAAADDALAAWSWFQDQARELGVNPKRMAVMGDSAGGNLAAVVSQRAGEREMPTPRAQCLAYPTLDASRSSESMKLYGEHLGLTRSMIDWFDHHYLGDPADARHPMASPIRHRKLKGQPATVLTVCTDPLRDEGLDYARRLEKAGVQVDLLDYPELVHGFLCMGGMIPAARRALLEICDTFGKML